MMLTENVDDVDLALDSIGDINLGSKLIDSHAGLEPATRVARQRGMLSRKGRLNGTSGLSGCVVYGPVAVVVKGKNTVRGLIHPRQVMVLSVGQIVSDDRMFGLYQHL